jgi:PilZ domain
MELPHLSDETDMMERRNDSRLLCAELVQITYRDESGRQCRRLANLEDISLSGICIQLQVRIPDQAKVTIRHGDGELVGTVRYCSFRDDSFFLGVKLEPGCRWSTKHFRPKHLLDPRQLVEDALQRHSIKN